MITTNGIIVDFENNPIMGAHIYTYDLLTQIPKKVAVSDFDGKFQIVTEPNEPLKVSYVGFNDYYFVSNGQKNIITLADSNTLNEVVVIGEKPTTSKSKNNLWIWLLVGGIATYFITKKQPKKVIV